MARQRSLGTHRYQLRALSSIARFLPVFVGVLLGSVFSLSVLRDDAQVARIAFEVGNELLGLYGGFGVIALPFLFLVTARLRRGRPREVTFAELRKEEVVLELASQQGQRGERMLRLPLDRIRSGYSHAAPDGRVRVNLELSGGLSDGDRIELDLDPDVAEPLVRRVVGPAPEFELTRTGVRFDAALAALSVGGGFALASTLAERVHERVLGAAVHSPAMGWSIGLCVAAVGLTNAFLTLMFAPRRILVGVDGLRVEGVFRRQFIAYESIAQLRATKRALIIESISGRRSWLFAPGVEASRLDAIARLANERLSPDAGREPLLPSWQPGTLRRWREAILKSVDATSYRGGSLSDDDLATFLSAPGVPRERRVAAAIALASRGEREVKENIRVAASCLADDATRRILERVAEDDDDDDALETLLSEQRVACHKQV